MKNEIIKIKLYGEGIAIRKIEIPDTSLSLDSNLYEGQNAKLLDPYFYHALNSPLYKNIYNLSTPILFGLVLNNNTRIEIWKKGKRARNLTIKDLLFSNELFPIFLLEQQEIEISQKEYYYVERSIGLICTYSFPLQSNSLDFMNFLKTDIFGLKVLFDIGIPNFKPIIKRQNSLITNQNIQKHTT